MKHPHAEIIHALADDGLLTLWTQASDGKWHQVLPDNSTYKILYVAEWWKRKFHFGPTPPPEMVHTECGSYPIPLREAPPVGTIVYPANTQTGADSLAHEWDSGAWAVRYLERGVLHLTREAAEQQAKVELALRMKRHEGKV